MITESVEQFMEVARQLENEEAVLSHSRDDREGSRESDRDDDRERIRKGGSFERERKESNRYSPYPTSKSDRERAKKSSSRKENRVYVSNLPFSIKWQDLKDHMKKVGDVVFAEILEDSSGKSKGCGIVEFTSSSDAEKAIRELNDTDLGGRMLKIREDRVESDDRPRRPRERSSSGNTANILGGLGGLAGYGMMGLGQLGLLQQMSSRSDPSSCTVFVSNLDYRVTWAKLKDTFKAAGRVVRADISEHSDGKSKGHGTVQFETPVEAVNAVCVMNGKSLYDRTMNVRLDRESPYFSMFGGNTGGASSTPNLAGMAGMAGMNPFAMLQLQSMASLGGMAGLGGLAGFGAMNYGGTGGGVQGAQSSGLTTGGTDVASTMTTSGLAGAMSSVNPYASMFSGQGLAGQAFGGQSMMTPMTQSSMSKVDPTKQVFVRNLPWKVTWQELKDKFREAGRVVRADVLMDEKQRSKGCATVLFESAEEASRAISTLNGISMDGRQIEVRMDRG